MPPVRMPASAAEALSMLEAGLDYLNAADLPLLGPAAQGESLRALGRASGKFTAAHAGLMRAFGASGGPEAGGYASPRAWLVAMTQVTKTAATDAAKWTRILAAHPKIAQALAAGAISPSWASQIAAWTARLPEADVADADEILLLAAAGGAEFSDLAALAEEMYARSRTDPDPDDDGGFADRWLCLDTTFGRAGKLDGGLTPNCTAALRAVIDALGKNRGPEDLRTEGQRAHDALEEACKLLIRSKFLPDRAGQDTQVQVHVPFSTLRGMDGASALEAAWLAAQAGEPGYLAGKDAEAAACGATTIPVVTGHPDWQVVDQIIETVRAVTGPAGPQLSALIGKLAIDFVSGPIGIASFLRTRLLDKPYNSASLPLDIGYSENIPPHIRRAVILRDRHCAWPGCRKPPSQCDIHHITHRSRGGRTSLVNCVLLCEFHHEICIHRWGWTFILNPDGTTETRGPWGQVLRSHAPPTTRAG